MTSKTNSPGQATKLPRSTVTRYALGSIGTGGFSTLPGLVLIYYLTDNLGVTALAAGVLVTVAKIWDVIIDPAIGGFSDQIAAQTGTRRRAMVIGAIGLPLTFIVMFAVPEGMVPWVAALWVFLAYMAAETFFSLFQVPYMTLPADLTRGYKERTRLLTWRVVVLTVAILIFGAGGPAIRGMFPGNPTLGYLVMAIFSAVLIGIGLWITTTIVPRNAPQAAPAGAKKASALSLDHYKEGIAVLRESQPFRALIITGLLQALAVGVMLAGGQFVARWILGNENAVTFLFIALVAPAILCAPLWQRVAGRVGKERGYYLASVLYLIAALALIAMIWAPGWWIVVPLALAGAGYAGMQSLPMAMLPDVITHDDTSTKAIRLDAQLGQGRAGVFSGVFTANETTGMAFGGTILTIILATTGYIESVGTQQVTQPQSAIVGIAIAFSVVPAVLVALSLLSLKRYPLREQDFATSEDAA